jgi:hypothetical protein
MTIDNIVAPPLPPPSIIITARDHYHGGQVVQKINNEKGWHHTQYPIQAKWHRRITSGTLFFTFALFILVSESSTAFKRFAIFNERGF